MSNHTNNQEGFAPTPILKRHHAGGVQKAHRKGFTLVELIVVMAIFAIISTVVFVRHSQFNNTIVLTNLAYDVALSIREAQVFGLGSREGDIGSGTFSAYGIFFPQNDNTNYKLFIDTNDNNSYWDDTDNIVQDFNLTRGHRIAELCVLEHLSGGADWCYSTDSFNAIVVFRRPNPEALIMTANGANQYGRAEITLEAPNGTQRLITVTQPGQITVTNPNAS